MSKRKRKSSNASPAAGEALKEKRWDWEDFGFGSFPSKEERREGKWKNSMRNSLYFFVLSETETMSEKKKKHSKISPFFPVKTGACLHGEKTLSVPETERYSR